MNRLPSARGTGQLATLRKTIAALHPFATGDQGLAACGPANFRGRAACGLSANSALALPALCADQMPRFLDGVELPSRPPVLPTEVIAGS
jgi:hypothetical protein